MLVWQHIVSRWGGGGESSTLVGAMAGDDGEDGVEEVGGEGGEEVGGYGVEAVGGGST